MDRGAHGMIDTRVLIAAGALVASAAGGWVVNGWRLHSEIDGIKRAHAEALAANTASTMAAQKALDAKRDQLAQRIAVIDTEESQALKKANDETERLRRCIADGTCGLRVRAVCPKPAVVVSSAAPSSGMGADTSARLDRTVEPDYFALRDGINTVQKQLSACQRILRGERVE